MSARAGMAGGGGVLSSQTPTVLKHRCVLITAGWDEETLGSDQVRLIRTLLSAERAR